MLGLGLQRLVLLREFFALLGIEYPDLTTTRRRASAANLRRLDARPSSMCGAVSGPSMDGSQVSSLDRKRRPKQPAACNQAGRAAGVRARRCTGCSGSHSAGPKVQREGYSTWSKQQQGRSGPVRAGQGETGQRETRSMADTMQHSRGGRWAVGGGWVEEGGMYLDMEVTDERAAARHRLLLRSAHHPTLSRFL